MHNLFIIAAVGADGSIGQGGKLPWRNLTGDMRWFQLLTTAEIPEMMWTQLCAADRPYVGRRTTQNHVVMGRGTWESITGHLINRINWVVTRDRKGVPGVRTMSSLDCLPALGGNVFLIGGEEVFQHGLRNHQCKTAFITEVDSTFPDADRHFPLRDLAESFVRTRVSGWLREHGLRYRTTVWKRAE